VASGVTVSVSAALSKLCTRRLSNDGRTRCILALVAPVTAAQLKSVAAKLPQRVREHNLTLVAAGVAFYAFLALVPALIAIVSIYGLVADPNDVERLVNDVGSSLPAEVQNFLVFQLTSIVNANGAGVTTAAVIAIALALWSASGGMAALITGIHVAYEKDEPKGFVVKRGKALLLTLGAIAFLGVVAFFIVAVRPLLADAGLGTVGRILLGILSWLVLGTLVLVGIGLLYRFAVKDSPSGWLGFLTLGTVTAMVLFLVVSGLFAAYTANFASYGKTYGALASIVVVLLWLWLSSLVVLVGAEIDGTGEG
jgi:membrane protein